MNISAEIIEQIRLMASQGQDLNIIQKELSERGTNIRFMELRFLLLDHGIEIAPPPAPEIPEAAEESPAANSAPIPASEAVAARITVSIDELITPGTMISGKANFPSGIQGAWCFDQQGQFSWTALSATPSEQELRSFQMILNNTLSQGA